jgi:tRNA nucleotidyltransferase (CCA-adding enzyme)
MNTYLVGGAVRDKLLGYPVFERDWVVVGATPTELEVLGFQKVGVDFPVFLHPVSKEEYALARIERKMAPGYRGFVCDAHPKVTLEEDLKRRDLTINAMAIDTKGNLIDPYHGQDDLRDKVLRHVSKAFVEDPVRVLRVARFCARYYHLGFKVAEETRSLMYEMVQKGELDHLVKERVWQEWQRSLQERNPEQFILTLRACGALRVVLPELDALFGVPQGPFHHPEIDAGIHSLMVLTATVGKSSDPILRFAALVHDLGKVLTPMSGWPSHSGHDELGVIYIEQLCIRLRVPTEYRKFAQLVSRYHLRIHGVDALEPDAIVTALEKTDAFRNPDRFMQLLLICQADIATDVVHAEKTIGKWQQLLAECTLINAKAVMSQGVHGADIAEHLHQQRVSLIESLINRWKMNEK